MQEAVELTPEVSDYLNEGAARVLVGMVAAGQDSIKWVGTAEKLDPPVRFMVLCTTLEEDDDPDKLAELAEEEFEAERAKAMWDKMQSMAYVRQPYADGECPDCGSHDITLLAPEVFGCGPAFYVCKCGFIGQIGVGPVQEPLSA